MEVSMKCLNHITLTTGHNVITSLEAVNNYVLEELEQWLDTLVLAGHSPLPPPFSEYSAIATQDGSILIVTVFGPCLPDTKQGWPLVTFAIATDDYHADSLWASLIEKFDHPPDLEQPPTPWCAVAIHPTIGLILHSESMRWLGDFEKCCAWAWISAASKEHRHESQQVY